MNSKPLLNVEKEIRISNVVTECGFFVSEKRSQRTERVEAGAVRGTNPP